MPKYRSFVIYREQGYCGREEINLLVHVYCSRLSVFVYFSHYFLLFFSFVLLLFLLNAYFWAMVFPRNSYYCDFSNLPLNPLPSAQ